MLERIELKDFKSWRGHQTIGPFQPFTSIIGPNGSGKSNLMDAISFVLGITSAHLRSERLRDLIYRGRRLRRDGETQEGEEFDDQDEGGEGDADEAWVKAVYKDEDGKQFIFQRTVTLTGGSEYKLNGKVITYSKYNAALEGHNILVKAKNFLVFQGDVEAVARQSPKDLCRLIEQISGSLELAKDYDTTKTALDKATTLSTESFHSKREVAKEFKAFKEHQSESKRLTKLWQDKDEVILQHILWKLFHIQSNIDSASSSILTKNAELAKLKKDQGGVEKELAKVRKEQAEIKTQISGKERTLKGKEKTIDQEVSRLVSVRTQIEHAIRKIENSTVLASKVRKDEGRQQATVDELKKNLDQVEKLAQEAEREQKRLSRKKGQALSETDIAEYRQLRAKANTLLPDERSSLDSLRRREKTLRQEIEAAEEKEDVLRRKVARLESEISDLETRKDISDRKRENLETERSKAKKELQNLQSERTRIAQLETETNEKLQACYAKLLQAGADKKQSEKELKMKETISTLKRIFPGVHGRVIDLCKPTQTKYQTAVSVVLGRNIDGIVVDHEKTAIECINYLRTQRLGQAMFIPLDSIQVKPTNDKYRNFARGARLAIDVIEFNPLFEAALQHACGNSLICDSMDVARYVCYDKQQDVKAVTLEGTVIHKSGSITGGQSSQGAGRKWDEKEITNLQKQRDSLFNYLQELSKARPRGKSDDNLMNDIARCDSELALVRDDLSATELRLTSLRTEVSHARTEATTTTATLRDRRKSLESAEKEASTIAKKVNASEDGVFADFCTRIKVANIREYEDAQLRVAQAQSEARVRYTAQTNRLQRQLEFETEQLEHTQSRLRVLEKTLNTDQTNLKQLEADKDELKSKIRETEQEIKQIKTDIEDLQAKQAEVTVELDEIKKRSSKSTKTLDKIVKEIAAWNDMIERLGAERASIYRRCKIEDLELPLEDGSLEDVPLEVLDTEDAEAMDVDENEDGTQQPLRPRDYGVVVDFTDLADEDRENGSEEHGEELEAEMNKIELEIQQMAPTSKAAEKMGGIQTKLAETEKQVEKARKESATAREAFNTVRKQRTDLFNKAYTHISDRIDAVYKSLTRGNASPMGGVAYLNLEDTEEPYLAGVKYHAMPPMKRFRDMDQLSGGEQTVAALALLLAIHSYRPAPFFVLDEVDAALDNTNVTRVARYLREHSSKTFQFIVISLKDTLYERSNSLVGVYRDQDVNSSKSLTLDLQQYEEA